MLLEFLMRTPGVPHPHNTDFIGNFSIKYPEVVLLEGMTFSIIIFCIYHREISPGSLKKAISLSISSFRILAWGIIPPEQGPDFFGRRWGPFELVT